MKKLSITIVVFAIASVFAANATAQYYAAASPSGKVHLLKSLYATEQAVAEPAAAETGSAGNEASRDNKAIVKAYKSAAKYAKATFRASQNFKRDFVTTANVTWYSDENTIVASFNQDDIYNRVVYNHSGRKLHSMKVYDENKMSKNLQSLIDAAYPDDNIVQVQEITENFTTFYVVHLENMKGYKTIGVMDGECNILEQFCKQRS